MDYDITLEMLTDQVIEQDSRKRMKAAKILKAAIDLFDKAADEVNRAANVLGDDPASDRAFSMVNDMEDLICDLKAMREEYKRG